MKEYNMEEIPTDLFWGENMSVATTILIFEL
jgi:hypothetical protein